MSPCVAGIITSVITSPRGPVSPAPVPPDFPDVMVGASSPAQAVVGAYRARRLKIEHGQIDYVPGGPGRALVGHPGKVLRWSENGTSAGRAAAPGGASAPTGSG